MDTKELEHLPHEIETGKSHIIIQLIEYEHNAVVSKTILKKATGSITALSVADKENLNEKISPLDTKVQVIDGSAIIVIGGVSTVLKTGDGILIPAHQSSRINPNGKCKLILTVIKSGYEMEPDPVLAK